MSKNVHNDREMSIFCRIFLVSIIIVVISTNIFSSIAEEIYDDYDYIVVTTTNTFHFDNCYHLKHTNEESEEYEYDSIDTLIRLGYKPCHDCIEKEVNTELVLRNISVDSKKNQLIIGIIIDSLVLALNIIALYFYWRFFSKEKKVSIWGAATNPLLTSVAVFLFPIFAIISIVRFFCDYKLLYILIGVSIITISQFIVSIIELIQDRKFIPKEDIYSKFYT